MKPVNTFKSLLVWQKAMDLAVLIYKITETFPKEELYGLVGQMRKASVSISSNIAEGYARFSDKELVRFLHIALGSAAELETQIELSFRLEFLSEDNRNLSSNLTQEVSKMLTSLINHKNKTIELKQGNKK
jgi:four helix bundle protein